MEVHDNKAADGSAPAPNPLVGEHLWEVRNVSAAVGKLLSEPFEIGGYSCAAAEGAAGQLLAYPRGNMQQPATHIAVYLAVAEGDQQAFNLQRTAEFKVSLLAAPGSAGGDVVKSACHTFTSREPDFGFTQFVPFTDLWDSERGLLANDTLRIRVEVEVKDSLVEVEAQLCMRVHISTNADLAAQIGSSRHFDLVDHAAVKTFKLARTAPFSELRKRVAEEMGVPPERQRFWKWAARQNGTYRPAQVVPLFSEDQPISSIREASGLRVARPGQMATLNLFLETPATPDAQLPPMRPNMNMLLFFKQYVPDPQAPRLRYAGCRLLPKDTKVKELAPLLRSLGGLGRREQIEVYEEVKHAPTPVIDRLVPGATLAGAQLETGDILVFHRQLSQAGAGQVQCANARQYLEAVHNGQVAGHNRQVARPLDHAPPAGSNPAVRQAAACTREASTSALATPVPPPSQTPTPAANQQRPPAPRICAAPGCGATRGLKRCGGCGTVRYCNEACSKVHWRAHRAECRRLQAERVAAEQQQQQQQQQQQP